MVVDVDHYPKHWFVLWILEPWIGRAVFSVNGPEWARQRRLVDQACKLASLRRIDPDMKAAVFDLIERLRVVADGRSLAIDEELTLVTGDKGFGKKFLCCCISAQAMEAIQKRYWHTRNYANFLAVPTSSLKRFALILPSVF